MPSPKDQAEVTPGPPSQLPAAFLLRVYGDRYQTLGDLLGQPIPYEVLGASPSPHGDGLPFRARVEASQLTWASAIAYTIDGDLRCPLAQEFPGHHPCLTSRAHYSEIWIFVSPRLATTLNLAPWHFFITFHHFWLSAQPLFGHVTVITPPPRCNLQWSVSFEPPSRLQPSWIIQYTLETGW